MEDDARACVTCDLLLTQLRIRDVQLAAAQDAIGELKARLHQHEIARAPPAPPARPEILHASQLHDLRQVGKGSVSVVQSAILTPTTGDSTDGGRDASVRRVAVKIPRMAATTLNIINHQNAILHELSLQRLLPRHPGIVRPLGAVVLPARLGIPAAANTNSREQHQKKSGGGGGLSSEEARCRHDVVALVTELWGEGTTLEGLLQQQQQQLQQQHEEKDGEDGVAAAAAVPLLPRIRIRDVVFVARRLSSALDALHRENLIHGDVCARNVVIRTATRKTRRMNDDVGDIDDGDNDNDGGSCCFELGVEDAALIDFNLCSPAGRQLEARHVARRLESAYHSPDSVLTPKTDVYSLGYTIAQMCSAAATSEEKEPAPASLPEEQLNAIEALAHACLCPNPLLRPCPREVLRELARW